jgi:hypothetical protein
MTSRARREPHVLQGVTAGLIGGLAASWVMSHFQAEWTRIVDGTRPESAGGAA